MRSLQFTTFNNYVMTGFSHCFLLPFGELFISQRNIEAESDFDSRYKFTAKELDNETNYTYFGARYYDSDVSVWLSVDPMAGKFYSTSPYMYCLGEPIKLIDPNGMDTAFADNQARKDFLYTQKVVNETVNNISEQLKDSDLKKGKHKKMEKELDNWSKLKDDFDYITDKETPLITYSSDVSLLNDEQVGKLEGLYNQTTGDLISAAIYIRPERYSAYVHEGRHTRQDYFMPLCESEIEAFTYQSFFSPNDVQRAIDNAFNNKYPAGGAFDPSFVPKWGIKEMVKYVYKCSCK